MNVKTERSKMIRLNLHRDIGYLGEILSDLKFHGLKYEVTIDGDYIIINIK